MSDRFLPFWLFCRFMSLHFGFLYFICFHVGFLSLSSLEFCLAMRKLGKTSCFCTFFWSCERSVRFSKAETTHGFLHVLASIHAISMFFVSLTRWMSKHCIGPYAEVLPQKWLYAMFVEVAKQCKKTCWFQRNQLATQPSKDTTPCCILALK